MHSARKPIPDEVQKIFIKIECWYKYLRIKYWLYPRLKKLEREDARRNRIEPILKLKRRI